MNSKLKISEGHGAQLSDVSTQAKGKRQKAKVPTRRVTLKLSPGIELLAWKLVHAEGFTDLGSLFRHLVMLRADEFCSRKERLLLAKEGEVAV